LSRCHMPAEARFPRGIPACLMQVVYLQSIRTLRTRIDWVASGGMAMRGQRGELMKGLNWTAVGAFAFMIAGCASGEPPASGPTPPATEAAQVEVTNQNWSDVVVYAVRLNQPVRLGMVTSMSVERFKLPRSTASSGDHIRLMISPIGSSQ